MSVPPQPLQNIFAMRIGQTIPVANVANAASLNELRHIVERFDSVAKTLTTLLSMDTVDMNDAVTILTEFAKEAKGEKCGEEGYKMTPPVLFVCRRELFQACFTPEEVDALMKVLTECITNCDKCAPYTGFFLSLQDYMKSHRIDLENSLVGMTVSPVIADRLREEEKIRSTVSAEDITREVLISRMMSWVEEQNDFDIAENLRSFCSKLPSSLQTFKRGDMVVLFKDDVRNTRISNLYTLNDPGMVYARCMVNHSCSNQEAARFVTVTCDPLERTGFELPAEKVMSLPFTIKKTLLDSRPPEVIWDQYFAAKSFAEETSDNLIIDSLFERCSNLFPEKNDLIAILSPSFAEHAIATDKPRLECVSNKLKEMTDPMTITGLSFKCESALDPVITPFVKSVHDNSFRHMLGKNESSEIISQLSSVDLLNESFSKFSESVGASLDHVQKIRDAVIKGVKKAELSHWYLDLIHVEADKVLKTHGFDPNALPKNYTEVPPADMEVIKRNINICKELVEGNETIEDLRSMINRICEIVYERLDAFVLEMMQVLACDMEIPLDPAATHEDALKFVQTVNDILAKPEMKDHPSHRLWKNLAGDIEYIREMHVREGMKGTSKEIVPISGLIIGRIFRTQKELESVIEIWGSGASSKIANSQSFTMLSNDRAGAESAPTASPSTSRKNFRIRHTKGQKSESKGEKK